MNRSKLNIFISSFAFFLIYAACMTAQNFATTNDALFGPMSLGILYFMWIVSLFTISSSAVTILTAKYAMLIGSLCYPLYVLSGIYFSRSSTLLIALYLAASVLIGIGGGLLWVGQTSFIVQTANDYEINLGLPLNSKLGEFTGIWSLFYNQARSVGSLIAALMFTFNGSVHSVFNAMVVIGTAGSFTFLFIRKSNEDRVEYNDIENAIKSTSDGSDENDETEGNSTCHQFGQEMKSIIALWKDRRQLFIVPVTFAVGLSQTFISGELPSLIEDNAFKFYMLTVEGLTASISCILFGKAADKWGALPFLVMSCLLFSMVYIFFFVWNIDQNAVYIWSAVAAVLGVADGGIFTLTPQIHPILLGDKKAVSANMRMIQAIASCVGFAYFPFTSFHFRLIANLLSMALAIIFLLCSKQIRNALLTQKTEKKPSPSNPSKTASPQTPPSIATSPSSDEHGEEHSQSV